MSARRGVELAAAIDRKVRHARRRHERASDRSLEVVSIKIPPTTGEQIKEAFGRPPGAVFTEDLPETLFGLPVIYDKRVGAEGILVLGPQKEAEQ